MQPNILFFALLVLSKWNGAGEVRVWIFLAAAKTGDLEPRCDGGLKTFKFFTGCGWVDCLNAAVLEND